MRFWSQRLLATLLILQTGSTARSAETDTGKASSLSPRTPVEFNGHTLTLTKLDQLPCVENDYSRRFRFDVFDNPKLVELRERYRLDEVVAPGKDEFDRQIHLMDWTHRRFDKFGQPSVETQGALEILAAIDESHRFFCMQYMEVFVSTTASLGWVARPLALRRHQGVNKVGGSTEHSVTEIWSNQHRKWVMLDPTSNLYLEKNGIPLNAWEIRQEWFYNDGKHLVFVIGQERKRHRKDDLPIMLKYFDGFGDLTVEPDELDKYGFIGYIPNTNLMDSGYDYAGMFIVKDALCDGTNWHVRDLPADPAKDPYFPIGQATFSLAVEADELKVDLQTLTPNFKRFETRNDGGDWLPSPRHFVWRVRPGTNRLEARSVNAFGVTGPVSLAEVIVDEGTAR